MPAETGIRIHLGCIQHSSNLALASSTTHKTGVSLVFISDFSRLCHSHLLHFRKSSKFSVSSFLPDGTLGDEHNKCMECVLISVKMEQ